MLRGEGARGTADEQGLDVVLDPVLLVDELELVLLVGVARREGDPAAADHHERRFDAVEVVVEDGGVGEGEADVGVADLDPAGPDGPLRGDADLVEPGPRGGHVQPVDRPGPAAPLQEKRPRFDDGRLVVVEIGLDEDAGRPVRAALNAGRPQGDSGHGQVVEVHAQPGPFVRPEPGLERGEVGGHVPGLELPLQALDKDGGGFGRRLGGAGLGRSRTGEQEGKEQDPEDRFSHGSPYYNINTGAPPARIASFVPRERAPALPEDRC